MSKRITLTCGICKKVEEYDLYIEKDVEGFSLADNHTCTRCRQGLEEFQRVVMQAEINHFQDELKGYKERLVNIGKEHEDENECLTPIGIHKMFTLRKEFQQKQSELLKEILALKKKGIVTREWWLEYRHIAIDQRYYIDETCRQLHVSYIRKQHEQENDSHE